MAKNIVTQDPPETTVRSPLFEWVKCHSLAAFFLLTFGYSGLLMFPVLASSRGWLPFHLVGFPALLLQLLAVWGPTLYALLIVLGAGLKEPGQRIRPKHIPTKQLRLWSQSPHH